MILWLAKFLFGAIGGALLAAFLWLFALALFYPSLYELAGFWPAWEWVAMWAGLVGLGETMQTKGPHVQR